MDDGSWTDGNLNRVSVIQFQEETKAEEEEDDEAAAERRVRKRYLVFLIHTSPSSFDYFFLLLLPRSVFVELFPETRTNQRFCRISDVLLMI